MKALTLKKLQAKRIKQGMFTALFVIIGAVLFLVVNAANPTAHFEAENASVTGNASVLPDAGASSEEFLQFGTGGVSEDKPVLVYVKDGNDTIVNNLIANGATHFTAGAFQESLDDLENKGVKGVVWLGAYDRTSCSLEFDDAYVTDLVNDVKGHPAIESYQLADEPRTTDCPNAANQILDRSNLVKSLDPTKPTYVTVDVAAGMRFFEDFAGTADIIGLVVYPCEQGSCNWSLVDQAIATADQAGIARYWAVIQAFGDEWYTMPTPQEFTYQVDLWENSGRAEGYSIYSWGYEPRGLDTDPDIIPLIDLMND